MNHRSLLQHGGLLHGQFLLGGLAAGKYELAATKRGYSTSFFMQHGLYGSAIVTGPGQETENLRFALEPSASIRGTVTADGGDAVAGDLAAGFLDPLYSPGMDWIAYTS